MQVIRYCVPFDDHELKKLVYAPPPPPLPSAFSRMLCSILDADTCISRL
jgi:hypothetical protein